MSNRVQIVRTEYTNLKSGETQVGCRILDDFVDENYFFTEGGIPEDDGELLRDISNHGGDSISELIDFAISHGIDIDGTWYSAEEVGKMLNP
jgi:hypothetical protein